MPTPEQSARAGIDAMLAAAGWTVQDIKELNLTASRGVAVREMQCFGWDPREPNWILVA